MLFTPSHQHVIKSLKVYYLLCVALFSFVIVYYYRLKQLENMSFSLLGGKKKREKKSLPTYPIFWGLLRQHNIFFVCLIHAFATTYDIEQKFVKLHINFLGKKSLPLMICVIYI